MEAHWMLAIHSWSSPVLDLFFRLSDQLGRLWFCVVLALGGVLWHRSRDEIIEMRLWLLLGLSTYLVQETLKSAVRRPRPELWPWLVSVSDFSFPSGHALASATFYPLLAFSWSRARPHDAPRAWATAVLFALYIGFGRLYLGVHWPSDVLAGWTLGAAQTAIGIAWAQRRRAAASA